MPNSDDCSVVMTPTDHPFHVTHFPGSFLWKEPAAWRSFVSLPKATELELVAGLTLQFIFRTPEPMIFLGPLPQPAGAQDTCKSQLWNHPREGGSFIPDTFR